MLVRNADVNFAVVWVENVSAMSGAVHKPVHRFVETCFDGSGDIAMRIGRAVSAPARVFGGILFAAREGVAHIRFEAIGSPVAGDAVRLHVFCVGLGGGVVVEDYFAEARCGSSIVYELKGVLSGGF